MALLKKQFKERDIFIFFIFYFLFLWIGNAIQASMLDMDLTPTPMSYHVDMGILIEIEVSVYHRFPIWPWFISARGTILPPSHALKLVCGSQFGG